MNPKPYVTGILIGGLLSFIGLPSQAHDTTDQLNQAICIEDWDGAIAILDNIIPDYPNSQNTLGEYRDRLQQLSTTGLSEEQKVQYCSPELLIPQTLVSIDENPLALRVGGYNEEIINYDYRDISYEEVTTIVQLPGKMSNLSYHYSWSAENGTSLAATFSDHQLEELSANEAIDCRENDECDGRIPPPAEFERLVERFEAGMNAQVVLQHLLRELGEPSYQREMVVYEWKFQEGETVCTLRVGFFNDERFSTGYDCGILPES